MPFVALMMLAVVVLCVFPEIATWFADAIMGAK
jgi:TRAP-type mannitol/chloroaromatic compound transport system permease large subunit